VNNALTGVIGHLELAQRGLSAKHPAAEHLEASRGCAFQAAEAVKRIVAFACRPSMPQTPTRLALGGLSEQLAEQLRRRNQPGLTIRVIKDVPGWVITNEVVFGAAVDQVVLNALEAMPAGGILQLHVYFHDDLCCLAVSDSGGGIAPDMVPYLFRPFRTTKASGHLGLGLVQARELVQLLGGTLDVVSSPGQGTTAIFALPAVETVEDWPEDPLPPGPEEAYASGCAGV
jgi:signal transduction histidine kinase